MNYLFKNLSTFRLLGDSFFISYFNFFKKAPALFYGIIILISSGASLADLKIISIVLLLILPFALKGKKLLTFVLLPSLLTIICYFLTSLLYPSPLIKDEVLQGRGYLVIKSKSLSTYFQPTFTYKGILKNFNSSDGRIFYNIPINMYLPAKDEFVADKAFLVKGKIIAKGGYLAVLKITKKDGLTPLQHTFATTEIRYQFKKKVSNYIKKILPDEKVSTFLSALITGELDDKILKYDFCKLGVQHILAISGFHFAVLTGSCFFILRCCFLSLFAIRLLLLLIINGYLLFLGESPSIERAYISIEIAILATIFQKRYFALNALGVALVIEILLDPLSCVNIGFQLSFLATFALLAISPIIEKLLLPIFKKRSLKDLKELSHLSIYGQIGSSFLRKAFALNLAVNLAIFPVLLFHFNYFPLLSLIYNLFFPLAVSLSLFLFILGSFISVLFPFIPHYIHTINIFYTKEILNLVSTCPQNLQVNFWGTMSLCTVIISLTVLFFSVVYFTEKKEEEKNLLRFL